MSILLGVQKKKMAPESIKLEKIREWSNKYRLLQPDSVRNMAASLQSVGQLQPIILQKEDEVYNLIDGIKRFRAAEELGLGEISSLVFEVDTAMAKAMIIHYNRQGSSLSMYEQGLIISSLVKDHSISQKEVSRMLRQSHSWVCRRLGMIDRLMPEVQDEICMGSISLSHGRELVKLPRGNQADALKVVIRERLTSRECAIVVDRVLKCKDKAELDFLYKNTREVILGVLNKDKYYDSRLSEHGNRLLKAREILKLEASILGRLLRDVQTEKLTEAEREILYPSLEQLPMMMSKLSEDINIKTQKK